MNITDPIYSDPDTGPRAPRALHWPEGPVCPHCGCMGRDHEAAGKSTRPGVHKCNECEKPFTVTVGTIMEDSKIPLNKWLMAYRAHQRRQEGHLALTSCTARSASPTSRRGSWRTASARRWTAAAIPLGGPGKIVEADETYVGGKVSATAPFRKPAPKKAVVALVERDGHARSFHVANVTGRNAPLRAGPQRRPRQHPHDRRAASTAVGPEFCMAHRRSTTAPRVRQLNRLAQQHRRELLLDLQARRDRHLPSHERGPSCTATAASSISATTPARYRTRSAP